MSDGWRVGNDGVFISTDDGIVVDRMIVLGMGIRSAAGRGWLQRNDIIGITNVIIIPPRPTVVIIRIVVIVTGETVDGTALLLLMLMRLLLVLLLL